ncbi:serine hydrolase [Acuticoccus sp. I52.16.1]|uniref:serine hydrolase n=1 Tax=Acuticoccus sp. I52.16.1 TaxID=2928472 RepID=UPI001FD14644|nr:serine hydrolase [Acuticoccus sp. I52.16.1]UOM36123.1 serine hydrolase [Acuticoccus sp. I52.16.1]
MAKALSVLLIVSAVATPAVANPKYAGLVVDAISGEDLYAQDADDARYPASLTKIMTLYLVFEELAAGRLTLDSKLTMSAYASARPPSKIGIKPGGTMALRDAIKALVTKSANDVATMVGENIEGSEPAFARRMTKTARRLGMSKTTYTNASGLPDPDNVTTARDQATLGLAIQRDFPQYYGVFQTRVFEYGSRRYGNHNRLLGRVEGVDGIKTGYIHASGFNLVTSVRRDGRQVVGVVMGGRTGASRNQHMTELINRYMPKAKRGTPMVYAAWSDFGPPPTPRARPTLAVRFASRLASREETPAEDPIQTILAFASKTREAVGPTEIVGTPRTATDALQAVIASTGATLAPATEPLPAGTTELAENIPAAGAAPRTRETADAAPEIQVASLDPAAGTASAPQSPAPRFAAAFDVFGATAQTRGDGLSAIIAMRTVPTSGVTIIAMGSAPQTVGERAPRDPGSAKNDARMALLADEPAALGESASASATKTAANQSPAATPAAVKSGWQIQLGAVDSEAAAKSILDDAARIEPAMAQQTRVTLETTTPNGTVFRARFGGFRSEADAVSACKRFTNHNRPCWAVSM